VIAVLLGAFFILAISVGVLVLVALPHLRRGSRILTPQGERTVKQARQRSSRMITGLPGRIAGAVRGSRQSHRGTHVAGGGAATPPAPNKRLLKDSLALPDPAEIAPAPEPIAAPEPEPVSLFEPVRRPQPITEPAPDAASEPIVVPEPIIESKPVTGSKRVTETEPVAVAEPAPEPAPEPGPVPVARHEPAPVAPEPAPAGEPAATTTPGGGVGRQRPSPAESGPISKPPIKPAKGGSKPRSKSSRGAPRGQSGGRGARRRDPHAAPEPRQVDVRDDPSSQAGDPASKRASSQ
jgi:hypothetical protein